MVPVLIEVYTLEVYFLANWQCQPNRCQQPQILGLSLSEIQAGTVLRSPFLTSCTTRPRIRR